MLIVNRIGVGAAAYYAPGPPGRWWGGGTAALGLEGGVDQATFKALLRGVEPGSGRPIKARTPAHQRAGWDLIFTAPKSVSLVAALSDSGPAIAGAHHQAVDDALRWFEAHGCWARRGGALVSTDGIVSARFEHATSSAGEPHLHTHVVVTNVVCSGGEWSALDGSGLWLQRRGLAAGYHLGLRHHIGQSGIDLSWQVAADGTADIAGVPRSAIDAVSSRRRAIQAQLGAGEHQGRAGEAARQRLRTTAAGPWMQRVAAAGFAPADADALLRRHRLAVSPAGAHDSTDRKHPSRPGSEATDHRSRGDRADPGPADRALVAEVVRHLSARRSTFGVVDVMGALAAAHGEGTTASEAHRWASALCRSSLPAEGGRWTTPYALAIDDHLRRLAGASVGRSSTAVEPDVVDKVLSSRRLGPQMADAVHRLTTSADGVVVLASPRDGGRQPLQGAWIAQATVLEAAFEAWHAARIPVAVETPSTVAASRWRALTGVAGRDAVDETNREAPSVLVVDRADRATTTELTTVLAGATRDGATVVLVEGGTLPARRRAISEGLEGAAADLGRIGPSFADRDDLALAGATPRAVDRLMRAWEASGEPGDRAVLVGLGPAECDLLNDRARSRLRTAGVIGGPDAVIGGRRYAPGDRVVTLRRSSIPAGTYGRIEGVNRQAGTIEVAWAGGGHQIVGRQTAPRIGHAYATTPAMLRLNPGPVMVLGNRADIGRHAGRVVQAIAIERPQERSRSTSLGLGR